MCCQRLMKLNQYEQNVDLLDLDEVHVFPHSVCGLVDQTT